MVEEIELTDQRLSEMNCTRRTQLTIACTGAENFFPFGD